MPTSSLAEKSPNGMQRWERTIDAAVTNDRWHDYDLLIQKTVAEFSRHLAPTRAYVPLDWKLIKAMVWTESGGPANRAWTTRPMQIGNPGDPGLKALLQGNEGGELILPPAMKARLTTVSAVASAEANIQAGVGYLLMRLARFGFASIQSTNDHNMHRANVLPGDTLSRIARRTGTTIDVLKKHNSQFAVLRPGQVLQFQKASIQRVITGWDAATTTRIAATYNVGDPKYSNKLQYCLSIMRKIQEKR